MSENSKQQITMTKIQNSKLCFGHLVLEFEISLDSIIPLLHYSITPAFLCLLLGASRQLDSALFPDNYSLKGLGNHDPITYDASPNGATGRNPHPIPDNAFLNYYVPIQLALLPDTNHPIKPGVVTQTS